MTQASWFGHAPNGWGVLPLYAVARERKDSNLGLREQNLLSLSYGRIVRKDINTSEGLLPASFETYQIVERDNIVLRMTDLQNDQRSLRSGLVEERGIITSAYLALALRGVSPRFIAYQLRAIDQMKVFYSMGGGLRQSIGYGDLKRMLVVLPPSLRQQRAIADFLDRETAQIDAFIAKNEELIALLTERRTATITRCVTSGLSGSEGLQEGHWTASVPDHWQVMPLRYAIRRIDQGVSPQAEAGLAVDAGQVGVLKSGCVNGGVFQPSEHKVLPRDFVFDPAIQIDVGDLLVNRASGSVSLLGSAAMVTENPYQLILSDKTFRIWPSGRTSRHYLYWLLNSRLYREQVEASVSGAEGLANNLPMSRLRSFRLPFPPRAEQRKLIVFLERETSAISQAILTASRGIDLARERRAALISAAVTGKIDVGVSA